jgi:hypothetical protein
MNEKTNKQLSNEEMSMAIINLQAMLNIEDIDILIKLLENHNWDVSLAAN